MGQPLRWLTGLQGFLRLSVPKPGLSVPPPPPAGPEAWGFPRTQSTQLKRWAVWEKGIFPGRGGSSGVLHWPQGWRPCSLTK